MLDKVGRVWIRSLDLQDFILFRHSLVTVRMLLHRVTLLRKDRILVRAGRFRSLIINR